jgi:hypothetical protein
MPATEQEALEERFRLEVQLRELCDKAGIDRPLSEREREIGLLALKAQPRGRKRGRPVAGPMPSQTAYAHFGLASWFHAAGDNWEAAYEAAAAHLRVVTPKAVKRNHLLVRGFFAEVGEDFEDKDAEYWAWWLTEVAGADAPDLDK